MKRLFCLLIILNILVCNIYAAVRFRLSSSSVKLGTISWYTELDAGYIERAYANGINISKASALWTVYVKTNATNMGIVGTYAKPISDFLWKAVGPEATQTTYTALTNYDVQLARSIGETWAYIRIDHKILLSWANDLAGDYSIEVIYTFVED